MAYDIRHNHQQHRFETQVDDLLCVIDYQLHDLSLSLTHVQVPKLLEGRGIAGELTGLLGFGFLVFQMKKAAVMRLFLYCDSCLCEGGSWVI